MENSQQRRAGYSCTIAGITHMIQLIHHTARYTQPMSRTARPYLRWPCAECSGSTLGCHSLLVILNCGGAFPPHALLSFAGRCWRFAVNAVMTTSPQLSTAAVRRRLHLVSASCAHVDGALSCQRLGALHDVGEDNGHLRSLGGDLHTPHNQESWSMLSYNAAMSAWQSMRCKGGYLHLPSASAPWLPD